MVRGATNRVALVTNEGGLQSKPTQLPGLTSAGRQGDRPKLATSAWVLTGRNTPREGGGCGKRIAPPGNSQPSGFAAGAPGAGATWPAGGAWPGGGAYAGPVRPERRGELDEKVPIAVICHSGVRSGRVATYLSATGFARVANVTGGIDLWAQTVDTNIARY